MMTPSSRQEPPVGLAKPLLLAGLCLVAARLAEAWIRPEFAEFTALSILRQGLEHPVRTWLAVALVLFGALPRASKASLARSGARPGPYKNEAREDILLRSSPGPREPLTACPQRTYGRPES